MGTESRPKIAVLFPAFLGGGAESVCAWMLNALKKENRYHISLLSLHPNNVKELNEQYGTDLSDSDVNIVRVPLPNFVSQKWAYGHSAYIFRQFWLQWYFRKYYFEKFDLAISASNEMDLGKPGIQYINFPVYTPGHEDIRKIVGFSNSWLRQIYRRAVAQMAGFNLARMKQNLTIANSGWVADIVKKAYDLDATVVYPPVNLTPQILPWEKRLSDFVIVSRIVPEKQIEKAINIIYELRKRGFELKLYIVGGVGDEKYKQKLLSLVKFLDGSSWVNWVTRLEKKEYAEFLSQHRYGIHTRENEQFGIGVAEMALVGCIPFVPRNGGPMEIVDYNTNLMWNTEQDAVEKIMNVLISNDKQKSLSSMMMQKAVLFSVERFERNFLECVNKTLGI